jgi:hypothetical protein
MKITSRHSVITLCAFLGIAAVSTPIGAAERDAHPAARKAARVAALCSTASGPWGGSKWRDAARVWAIEATRASWPAPNRMN